MRYSLIGNGGAWPSWIRELRGRSGFYAIRHRWSKRILYFGRSRCGRLYQQITRHFQAPRMLRRAAVEVAVDFFNSQGVALQKGE